MKKKGGETMDYEDPRTGICLTYQNWAEYFTGEFAHTIYIERMNRYISLSRKNSLFYKMPTTGRQVK